MAQFAFKLIIRSVPNSFTTKSSLYGLPPLAPINISHLTYRKKHVNSQYKKERAKKVLKVILPEINVERFRDKLSVEEIRSSLKERGIAPHKDWKEKPMYISCTNHIVDPYVPPKGDGKVSFIKAEDIKQLINTVEVKGRSYLALRKIQNIDFNFDVPTIAEKGKELYIKAQKALTDKNEDMLHELVTERAFEEMMESVKLRTIRWNFIQSLEPPRIVHIRCQEMLSKSNIFAQVTVRLFSQQTLAIYDRFGRLIHGSEDTLKDVLEYVVFEKHITNPHGLWRIHGKIFSNSESIKSLPSRTQPGEGKENKTRLISKQDNM